MREEASIDRKQILFEDEGGLSSLLFYLKLSYPLGYEVQMMNWKTLTLLTISNIFMNFAWYGHLKNLRESPLLIAILASWGIALFEYIFQVPANRLGRESMSLEQLKISQEVITLVVFAVFSWLYMKEPVSKNYFFASLCLAGAVYFIFKGKI